MYKIYTYTVTLDGRTVAREDVRVNDVKALKKRLERIYRRPCVVTICEGFKNGLFAATPRI